MKLSEVIKKNLEDAKIAVINGINAILRKIEACGVEPEVDLHELKGPTIVFREIGDQFSDAVSKVKIDSIEVDSVNAGEDFDVPFEELSTEMLIAVLEVLEDNLDEIFNTAKESVNPNSHD